MAALLLPIIVLNMFAGTVGGVWLLALGEWRIVLFGVSAMLAGAFIVSILLLPSLIFALPLASRRVSSTKFAFVPLAGLSVAYTYTIMGVWAISIFGLVERMSDSDSLIPRVLWSYTAATTVWNFLAQKDAQAGNHAATVSAFFNQIGCIALMAYVSLNFPTLEIATMAAWFGIPMIVSLILQTLYLCFMPTNNTRYL